MPVSWGASPTARTTRYRRPVSTSGVTVGGKVPPSAAAAALLLPTTTHPLCQSVYLHTYASCAITMPAHTSHAQHPISQYESKEPAATWAKLRAAEPIERTPSAMWPPAASSPTRRWNERVFLSKTSLDRSEPHSSAISACLNDDSGNGRASGRGVRSGCNGVVTNAPWPLRAAYKCPMNGA